MTEDDEAFEQWNSILFDPETDEDDETTAARPLFVLPLLAATIGYISHDVVYRTTDIPLTLDILWAMAIGGGVGLWFLHDVVEWIGRRDER